MYNMWHSKENQFGELFMYKVSFGSRHGPHGTKEQIDAMYDVWYFKENQLRNLNLYKLSFEDREYMAARNIYIKYLHPYSIPPQGRECMSNHCNGDLALLVSLWKFSIFSEIRSFNEEGLGTHKIPECSF
eukprot:NODE_49_length_27162_cov_0.380039.p12 type:complete len:130 gc:universal NODE_49_length_27162_cov_0.380039:16443-16832(+)